MLGNKGPPNSKWTSAARLDHIRNSRPRQLVRHRLDRHDAVGPRLLALVKSANGGLVRRTSLPFSSSTRTPYRLLTVVAHYQSTIACSGARRIRGPARTSTVISMAFLVRRRVP
jgi:hypothetical protein